ncbi:MULTISPECIES: TonB-dependent receptor [Sphingobium]|uniref:TonB-dependent receptor n=1 Tax=Sphingobium TaxID=165695 RepID=UPI00159C7E48|nr:TonB-dependent receptor [Sphingobium sp. 15-1]
MHNKKMRGLKRFSLALGALLSSASYAQSPAAQARTASPVIDGAADTGTEIIVTAQRRSERLQDTPIAVTAVTAEVAQNLGLNQIQDIAAIAPSASFTTSNNFFSPYIRGIGTAYVSIGIEAPVAIYEDGAYLTRTLSANEVLGNFDVGSIQVLRGPQGTLYGRNATGGVVIINSADPVDEIQGRVRGEFGNIDHRRLDAMVNVPLGQDLALRVTGGYRHEGDYMHSIVPNARDIGGGRAYNARAKLRWSPGRANIVLGGQYYNTAFRLGLASLGRNDSTCYACTLGPGVVPEPRDFYDYTGNQTVAPLRTEFYGANLNMTFDFDQFDVSSVTTYRRQKIRDSVGDSDNTPALIFEFGVPESGGKSITQDLQVSSKLEGRFNYLFGLSYLNDNAYFDPCFLGAAFGGFSTPETGGCFTNTAKTVSYAAFLETYYEVSDQLKVTLGGRYTYEERSASGNTNAVLGTLFGAGGAFSFKLREAQRAFTPRFVLAWDNGPTNIYYSYTRGFKAGGFSGPLVFPAAAIKPEKIFSHEVGIKQSMWDHRLRLNVAAFYFKNKNQQVQTLDPQTSSATAENAGALENYGVEVEAQATPLDGLNIGLSGAWQHARYKPFRNAAVICFDPTGTADPTTPGSTLYSCSRDLTGTAPPHAPNWSGSFHASYKFAVASWIASLSGIAEYRGPINYFSGAGGDLGYDRSGRRILVNASGYVSPPGENLKIGFYANNLFNKKYADYRQTAAPWGTSYTPGRPRSYGLRLEYSY